MRFLYSIALYILTPLLFAYLAVRSLKAPAYRRGWRQRLGLGLPQLSVRPIWLHAASVGETQAAAPLIKALLERYPEVPLLITSMTPTGAARVQALVGDRVLSLYLPLDVPGAVRRFYRKIQPRLGIVMETELWPNLFAQARARGVPLLLASARLSARSCSGYARARSLVGHTLRRVDLIAAQTPVDAQRFLMLGARNEQVRVLGNIKYDIELPGEVREQGRALRARLGAARPVWIAASTREGEEEQVLEALAQLRRALPGSVLILVPRHPERFEAVKSLCRRAGYRVVCRSEERGTGTDAATAEIYLGDTLGELLSFYAAADVAFVGGSLVPVGGHNVLEPAALGLPIVTGPQVFNFADAVALLDEADAIRTVADSSQLGQALIELLGDADLRQAMGSRASRRLEENRGTLLRLLAAIESLLEGRLSATAAARAGSAAAPR
jgi:3-deoxy-D-manno-octulosonic-acid transferase